MRVSESWTRITEELAEKGVADAGLEAEMLIRGALKTDRTGFFSTLDQRLTPTQEGRVSHLLERRTKGEPLAYILGSREFYGLAFYVNPSVLIPRQETELLVDKALEYLKARGLEHPAVADVGTGSGAIAVAIASQLPGALLYATDSSRDALLVADANRRRHSVSDTVDLVQSDLLRGLQKRVNLIVSNPPYLRTGEMASLPGDVTREPRHALHGGVDGLDVTRQLIHQAPSHLRPGGQLLVEIAPQQLEAVLQTSHEAFPGGRVSFARDLLGLPRVVIARLPEGAQ
jgi:release factor glutamine methyltransferase